MLFYVRDALKTVALLPTCNAKSFYLRLTV